PDRRDLLVHPARKAVIRAVHVVHARRAARAPYTTLFRSVLLRDPCHGERRHGGGTDDHSEAASYGPPVGVPPRVPGEPGRALPEDRKRTRLNSSHDQNSYAVFCLKKSKFLPQVR